LVPVLVEAIKEQQAIIDEKRTRIEKLEQDNEFLARALERLSLRVASVEALAKENR